MAPELSRKRRRVNVSYKEPSSDDFSGSDSEHASNRKRPTRRSTRNQSTEIEPESPARESMRISLPSHTRKPPEKRMLRRNGKRNLSYRDESTEEEPEDEEGDSSEADYESKKAAPARKPSRPQARSQPSTSKESRNNAEERGRPRKNVLGAVLKQVKEPEFTVVPIPTDGHIPDMSSLPYHVLLQIFVYASHPLHDENMHATPAIPWLIKMARSCQAFAKPALTALYRNPPIFAVKQNRKKLVHQLITPPDGARQDYNVMVKRLELDVTQMYALTDATNSVADLADLVCALTTLKEIDIFDPLDRPPYRKRLKRVRRWTYPPELFQALRKTQLHLQSWRWHSDFCAQDQGFMWMKDVHGDTAFQSLRDVTFVSFNVDEKRKPEAADDQPSTEELFASAIAVLPNLQSLTFESCTTVSGKLLPLLPSTLRSLSIVNCINLTSDALQGFLSDKGRTIEALVLNHNQSLDLSFLTTLKVDCPRLELLKMDLNYYSTLAMSSDNEPLYDWLLGLDEVPTWPTTLHVIDLQHLRNWGAEAATNLLTSLVDSAADLPFLREVRILATVDMNWRDRAEFRQKWAARFQKVFACRDPPPSPHLVSLKAYREWKQAGSGDHLADRNDSMLDITAEDVQRETKTGLESSISSNGETHNDVSAASKGRDERWDTKRLRSRAQASTNYDETSDNENDEEPDSIETETNHSGDEPEDVEPTIIQGRCHTVLCRIDNLRPREEMFDEADFLDEEASGDEEWNENNDEIDDGYAW